MRSASHGSNVTDDQTPLRAELFSVEQMEQHGRALAATHVLSTSRPRTRLLERLDENEQVLIETFDMLTAAVRSRLRIAPSGEWLLDNFYLIEEQIRTARQHLPKEYSRGLPHLAHGPSRGLPRVYDIALEAISHGDGRIDSRTLARFVTAYQSVTPLTLGELWAIPIMLRLALIENLRRVSGRITTARMQASQAQRWADQMTEIAESDPKSLILVIADMARSDPPMGSPFVAELVRRLQDHGLALALPLTWIEQRLAESSLTIEQMVQSETQQQAADQVSVSNTIGSLRSLGAMDWRVFVEDMSLVEQALREDPPGAYRLMDFATRDRYRHVVARLAKHSPLSESSVAQAAIGLAHASAMHLWRRRSCRPRRPLPDRPGPAAVGTRRGIPPPACVAIASMDRPVSAASLPLRDPGDDHRNRRSLGRLDARGRFDGLATGIDRSPGAGCREPAWFGTR